MKDEDFKDMVISHDKDIVLLATSIESLANNVGSTNNKLDDVIDVITQQNVLVERINNLDTNVAESFNRAWGRLEKLEHTTANEGCEAAKMLHKEKALYSEKLTVSNKRIGDLEKGVKDVGNRVQNTLSGTTTRWAIGIFLFYAVTFGSYVVDNIHTTDRTLGVYMAADAERTGRVVDKLENIKTRLSELRDTRPYGPAVDRPRDF